MAKKKSDAKAGRGGAREQEGGVATAQQNGNGQSA